MIPTLLSAPCDQVAARMLVRLVDRCAYDRDLCVFPRDEASGAADRASWKLLLAQLEPRATPTTLVGDQICSMLSMLGILVGSSSSPDLAPPLLTVAAGAITMHPRHARAVRNAALALAIAAINDGALYVSVEILVVAAHVRLRCVSHRHGMAGSEVYADLCQGLVDVQGQIELIPPPTGGTPDATWVYTVTVPFQPDPVPALVDLQDEERP